jgi:hypothetical protein
MTSASLSFVWEKMQLEVKPTNESKKIIDLNDLK